MRMRSNSTTSPESIWAITRFEQLYRRTGFFAWRLGHIDSQLQLISLPDLWRGKSQRGADILNGTISLEDRAEYYARFDWLRDVQNYGGTQARRFARDQIDSWMARHGRWSATGWRPDIMAHRLINLIFCFNWFGQSAADDFQQRLLKNIAIQHKCLSIDWTRLTSKDDQLVALTALLVCQYALSALSDDKPLSSKYDNNRLIDLCIRHAEQLIHDDGGHISRQPETHFRMMQRLIECRTVLSQTAQPIPASLEQIIQKMGRIVKFWRKPDAGFAHFNFAGRITASEIDFMLSLSSPKGGIATHLPDTGFARLSSARTLLLIDTGTDTSSETENPAGRFSFELCVGAIPVIVNPGQRDNNIKLKQAFSQTAAHSTLSLDNHSSDRLGIGNKRAGQHAMQTRTTEFNIGEAGEGQLVMASHDGFLNSHGITHTRQIFLASSGRDIRGSDNIIYSGRPGEIPRFAIIRFHLHPRISAAISNRQVFLKLPRTRNRWLFKAKGAEMSLQPSVFFDGEIRQNCQQIVLSVPVHDIQTIGERSVSWAIRMHKPAH